MGVCNIKMASKRMTFKRLNATRRTATPSDYNSTVTKSKIPRYINLEVIWINLMSIDNR